MGIPEGRHTWVQPCRESPAAGKLLGVAPENAESYIRELRETASSGLSSISDNGNANLALYGVRQLEAMGFGPADAETLRRRLREKWSSEQAAQVVAITFSVGAGIGYYYPDEFRRAWERTYEDPPLELWEKWREFGLEMSGPPEALPLAEAIPVVAGLALMWAAENAPALLDDAEKEVLTGLAGDLARYIP